MPRKAKSAFIWFRLASSLESKDRAPCAFARNHEANFPKLLSPLNKLFAELGLAF